MKAPAHNSSQLKRSISNDCDQSRSTFELKSIDRDEPEVTDKRPNPSARHRLSLESLLPVDQGNAIKITGNRYPEGNVSPPLHRDCNEWQQLKRARLTTSLNHRLVSRPGPLELIQGNILPGSAQLQQALQQGSIQFKRTKEGNSCSGVGCDSTANPKSTSLVDLPVKCPLSDRPASTVTITGTSLASTQAANGDLTSVPAPIVTIATSLASSLTPLATTSLSSTSPFTPSSTSSSFISSCATQSPLFSPLNLDLPIDLQPTRSMSSPIYAVGCPSPLLQRIPATTATLSHNTMAATTTIAPQSSASTQCGTQNSADTLATSIGSNPMVASQPSTEASNQASMPNSDSLMSTNSTSSLLQRGLRPHQLPSTVQFHLQQNQYRHAQMASSHSNGSGVMSTSRLADSRCSTMHCSASGALMSRSKKNKCKSQPKTKTIKFHEYKGPPNVSQPPKSPNPNLIPANESNETSYELLLKQQQLFLQWQLELQNKNSLSPCQSMAVSIQLHKYFILISLHKLHFF